MSDEGIDRLYDEVIYLRREKERLLQTLERVGLELKAYKEHYHRILDLQAEVLLTQPLAPIIIKSSELGSSAAEVAAKEKAKEA